MDKLEVKSDLEALEAIADICVQYAFVHQASDHGHGTISERVEITPAGLRNAFAYALRAFAHEYGLEKVKTTEG